MIFAVRDGQKWDGPGTAHPCSIPHCRLGGIPQGSSKRNKHPLSHSRVPSQGLCAQAGAAARAELRVKQGVLYLKLPFVFSLLKQKGLNSMFIIKTKLFCSAWGKQTYLQGFYCYAELGLAKLTVLFFYSLPAATSSNHTTSYQYQWSQSGLCCLQRLVFSLLSSSLNW